MIIFKEEALEEIIKQIKELNQEDDPIIFSQARKKILFDIDLHKIEIDWD